MSTVTVTYNFPEDRDEFLMHQSAYELKSVINEVYEDIRLHLKHGDSTNHSHILEQAKQKLAEANYGY
jgi:hypothetical protein